MGADRETTASSVDGEKNQGAVTGSASQEGATRLTAWPAPALVPRWQYIVGLLIGAGLLVIALAGVDLAAVWSGMRQARAGWVAVAVVAVGANSVTKIVRWRGLFEAGAKPDFLPLTRALLVGQLANALLPVRVGDVARAYLAGQGGAASGATALGTIAAEKALDAFSLLVCAALSAWLAPLPSWVNLSLGGLVTVGGVLLLLAVAVPERWVRQWAERWGGRLSPRLGEWAVRALQQGLAGLSVLRRPRVVLAAVGWSIVIWVLAVAVNVATFRAFDLPLSAGPALSLVVLLYVGVAPPSSPGRVGVFHALTVLGLAAFGIDRMSGLACATVLHIVVYLPQILPGVVFLVLGRQRFAEE